MAERQNYIVRNGVAQPYPIPDAPRPTITEMRQLLRGYDQQGTLLPNAAIITNDISKVDILRCGTLYADNIAGIVAETWTNPEPVYITIGGVQAGSVLTDKSAIDILEMMLYPYLVVTFSAFSVGLPAYLLEIGQSISAGNYQATWTASNIQNLIPSGISITYAGVASGTIAIAQDYADSETFYPHPSYVSQTVGSSLIFTINADQLEGSNATKTEVVSWRSKIYVGKNTSAFYTDITNFSNLQFGGNAFLQTNQPVATISMTDGAGYVYIYIHESIENITSVSIGSTDQTPAFPFQGTISMTNSFGNTSTYKVYKSSNQLNGNFLLNIK